MSTENTNPESAEGGASLPIDARTLLVGLYRRRKLLILTLVVAPLLGALAGLVLGKRTYQAETVMLFQPSLWARGGTGEAPSLRTAINMVKLESNLEETRRRLQLSTTLTSLASSVEVQVQKETTLLALRARSDSPQGAARLANTLRDVYLETQVRVRQSDARRQLSDLEGRLKAVQERLSAADAALQKYVADNRIVDLDKELNRYLEEYTSIDILYQQALADELTVQRQAANIKGIVEDLKAHVAQEESSSAQLESLGDLNIRSQRLRESIHDDKEQRTNFLSLAQARVELQRAEFLLTKGAISHAEVDAARTAYQKQEAISVDPPQVKAWKAELEKIDRTVLPKNSGNSASAPILKEMTLKRFAIQLDSVSMREKVQHLKNVRAHLKEKLEGRAGLQRGYQALVREISSREAEKKILEEALGQARRAHESLTADFTVVGEALPPPLALKSNRRMVFLAVMGLCVALGWGAVVALELTDPTVKSPAQASLRLRQPLLAALPRLQPSLPGEHPAFDALRLVARRLQSRRVLLTSATAGEGTSFVADHLAACLERQERRVLVVDCALRSASGATQEVGLAEVLSGGSSLQEVLAPGPLPNLWRLAPGSTPGLTDRLGGPRMVALLEEADRHFDVVIIDCPGLHSVEADLVCRLVHEVVLVVRARGPHLGSVQRGLSRLVEGDARVSGVILNQVDPIYLESGGPL